MPRYLRRVRFRFLSKATFEISADWRISLFSHSYLKCIYIMINEGKGANGAQILKPETVDDMWKDQLAGKQPEKINALGRDIPNIRPDLTNVVSP